METSKYREMFATGNEGGYTHRQDILEAIRILGSASDYGHGSAYPYADKVCDAVSMLENAAKDESLSVPDQDEATEAEKASLKMAEEFQELVRVALTRTDIRANARNALTEIGLTLSRVIPKRPTIDDENLPF